MTVPTREERLLRALSRLTQATEPFARVARKCRDGYFLPGDLADSNFRITGTDFMSLSAARAEALLLVEDT